MAPSAHQQIEQASGTKPEPQERVIPIGVSTAHKHCPYSLTKDWTSNLLESSCNPVREYDRYFSVSPRNKLGSSEGPSTGTSLVAATPHRKAVPQEEGPVREQFAASSSTPIRCIRQYTQQRKSYAQYTPINRTVCCTGRHRHEQEDPGRKTQMTCTP